MSLSFGEYRAVSVIDLDAAERNFKLIQGRLKNKKNVICVLKADAYGHGARELSGLYSELSAYGFAVANIDEGSELRLSGVTLPILVLGYTPPSMADALVDLGLTQCVFSEEYAIALDKRLGRRASRLKVHVKVDTGMGRLGFLSDEGGIVAILRCIGNTNLCYEGIFTHFSSADRGNSGREYTEWQAKRFSSVITQLGKERFGIIHASNSAAILDYPDLLPEENAVRAGIALYGYNPSGEVIRRLPLTPVMELKCTVAHVKWVAAGSRISYGGDFVAREGMRIATLPVGYADGIPRADGIIVLVNDRLCVSVGRICMDQMMIDVTDTDVSAGDEITIFGKPPALTAESFADSVGGIAYTLLTGISRRVERIYIRDGREVHRRGYLDLCRE